MQLHVINAVQLHVQYSVHVLYTSYVATKVVSPICCWLLVQQQLADTILLVAQITRSKKNLHRWLLPSGYIV